MKNRLQFENSPYLLQHSENPVDWYPWSDEAFRKAEREDKPVFLSIGYSTCHWCHVMAHESFENEEIAQVLNRSFVCVKVDREERPDVDAAYMLACQAMTGGGGWPTSLFLTPERKPFYAGTYFPPAEFYNLLLRVAELWKSEKKKLLKSSEKITKVVGKTSVSKGVAGEDLLQKAVAQFERMYDAKNGGFGKAPKFPTPHNLIFLLLYDNFNGKNGLTDMVLHTLLQMRKGGIYDHIGGGFSRYSVDERFLVPHFEKMLYDNALLVAAYSAAFSVTKEDVFLDVAEECAGYLLREMRDEYGGFYAAQDADSEYGEGMYYILRYDEVISVLGEEKGIAFCEYYGITGDGNFEGKNIPNRLHAEPERDTFTEEREKIYKYRKERMKLHLDDKILTSWNSLVIIAFVMLYRVSGKMIYLQTAQKAEEYIRKELCENNRLYVGSRNGKCFGKGVLDDYAYYCASLVFLYSATGEREYLRRSERFCCVAIDLFSDSDGGFFMNGKENEKLFVSVKESYDGAIPSGNSAMMFVLTRLSQLTSDERWKRAVKKQSEFLYNEAFDYPAGYSVYLLSCLIGELTPPCITAVCDGTELPSSLVKKLPLYADVNILCEETEEYKLKNGRTTFYVCKNKTCLPPTNDIRDLK